MVRFFSQQRIQERFASWLVAAAMGLNRNKDSINLGELFRIIQAQNPAAIRFAVHVQNAEIHCVVLLARFGVFLSPDLESAGILHSRLVIEIKSIKDQGLALGVEHAPKGLAGTAAAVHIKDVGDVKPSRTHQLPNITIGGKILLIILEPAFLISVGSAKLVDFRL